MSLDSVSSGHQDASKGDKIDIGRGLSGLTGLTKALNATLLERLGMKISLKSVAYLHQYLRMCLKLDSFLMRLRQTVNKGIKQREPSSRRADGRAKD